MTDDFAQDLIDAADREGVSVFIATTKDGECYRFHSTMNRLPDMVKRDGETLTRKEDFMDAIDVAAADDLSEAR